MTGAIKDFGTQLSYSMDEKTKAESTKTKNVRFSILSGYRALTKRMMSSSSMALPRR